MKGLNLPIIKNLSTNIRLFSGGTITYAIDKYKHKLNMHEIKESFWKIHGSQTAAHHCTVVNNDHEIKIIV